MFRTLKATIRIIVFTVGSVLWYSHNINLIAQSLSDSAIQEVQVQIDPDSSDLEINGTTNVNSFTCIYKGELPEEHFRINVLPSDTSKILRGARLKLKVTAFDCGKDRMNKDFYDLLKYEQNPHIYLDVAEFWKSKEHANSQNESEPDYHTQTIFTIAGNTEKYLVDVINNQQKSNRSVTASGKHNLDITDFGLTPPKKFLGMIKVDKIVTIEFKLDLTVELQPES